MNEAMSIDAVAIDRFSERIFRVRIGEGTAPGQSYLPVADPAPAPLDTDAMPSLSRSGENIELRGAGGETLLRLLLPHSVRAAGKLCLRFGIVGEQHFYGLGHGGQPFDRLGVTRNLWNRHVNHGGGSDIAIPLLVSHRGYAVFFDSTAPAIIGAGKSDAPQFDFTAEADGLDIFFLLGGDLRGVLREVANLLGHATMPPRWTLGFLQSTRHMASLAELEALGTEFRAREMPCDALILLSTYGEARGWNRGVGHLEPLDPEFSTVVDRLHARNLHVVTHEYPVLHAASPLHAEADAGGHLFAEHYPDPPPVDRLPASYHEGQRYLDFSRPDVGTWWWDQHAALVRAGIDGWWLDGGEGPDAPRARHNRFDLDRQKAFADGEARDRPGQRPFLLCRSGGAGMQRFGAACWSGDVNNSFASLEAQIALGLNVGMSGVPFWGTDIGGFYPTAPEDSELFVRWFQFGAFTPIFRAHGRNWRNRLPWSYGPEIEAICRKYLELRYRLLPYTYGLAWQAHRLGLPMMRPLVLYDPDDPQLRDCSSAYLWGDDILVAPVTRAGAAHWPVYLPRGRWFDYWTGDEHAGGRAIEVAAPLDRLPLFVRAGAIIPMCAVQQHATAHGPDEILLDVYPGGASRCVVYEDDGRSRNYQAGACVTTECSGEIASGKLTLRVEAPVGDLSLLPEGRRYRARILTTRPPRDVRIVGERDAPAWEHDGHRILSVRIPRHPAIVTIEW